MDDSESTYPELKRKNLERMELLKRAIAYNHRNGSYVKCQVNPDDEIERYL